MNALGRIVMLLLAAMLLFVFPLQYYGQKQEAVNQSIVSAKTAEFVDTVRQQGKITQDMYNKFMSELDKTDTLYRIEIEHSHRRVVPNALAGGGYEAVEDYDKHYEDEILYDVFERVPSAAESSAGVVEGEYRMAKGDYITVTVTNREKTNTVRLQEIVFRTVLPSSQITTVYGGEIRDENY